MRFSSTLNVAKMVFRNKGDAFPEHAIGRHSFDRLPLEYNSSLRRTQPPHDRACPVSSAWSSLRATGEPTHRCDTVPIASGKTRSTLEKR
jgi:hypothetical protein